MARYQVILTYEGARFQGSQRQANSRTVQGELENALRKVGWPGGTLLMAGRTDAGVHATGQVAAFDLNWFHSEEELVRALNANLPEDLAAREARVVAEEFHPRFDALSRRYRYRLFCQPLRDPLREKMAWRVWPEVRAASLRKAAALFLGTHDFSAFGSATTPKGTTVRTVCSAAWTHKGDEWLFEIEADAFLYRMVRRLVYLQVACAQGRCSFETLGILLADPNGQAPRALPSGLAPACGLTLAGITYER